MKQTKASKFICLILAACLTLSMAACGRSNPPSQSSASPESSDLSNTLVYAGESITTLNPLLDSFGELPPLIFSGLMKYDGNGMPVCDLAESYTFDEPSLTYTFMLRSGVTWHDGTEFTADDVVYTYNLLTNDETLSSNITSDFEDMKSVTATDPHTVVIQLQQYNAGMLGNCTVGILPRHLTEGSDINTMQFNQAPVGTGRYRFISWDTADGSIILERNTNYYGKVPNIERLVYKTVAVESTKATMLGAGEADLAWLNAKYADTFRQKDGYQNIDFKTADYRGISMDFNTKFWQDNADSVGVLNYAIDKASIVKSVLNEHGAAAYSPLQLNRFGGNTEADLYPYDLVKFEQEMKKLGWTKGADGIYERNGQAFRFTIQVRDYEEERVDIAQLCASQLNAAGVAMQVELVTAFDWKSGYNGFLSGSAAQFDADMFYKSFVTGASENTMNYSNPRVDDLLGKARHTKDEAERKKIYQEFEAAYAEQPGIVLIAFMDGCYVSTTALSGLDTSRVLGHHAVGVMWNIEDWTLNK